MKKILTVLFSLISVICISFAFSGCFASPKLFTVGEYETFEIEDKLYLKAKLIILPITEEQFETANGINVIKNNSKDKENNIYYSFELFLYDDIQEEYVQAEISNLHHEDGMHPDDYNGKMECYSEIFELNCDFAFYNNCGFNGVIIYYQEDGETKELRFELVS